MKKMRLYFSAAICLIAILLSSQTQAVNVTFSVDMQYQTVHPAGVHIAGSFQGWNPSSTPLTPPTVGSLWTITVDIPAATTIQYKFVNGDTWGQDESVFGSCGAGNGNRIYTVPATPVTLPVVCFGSCLPCVLPLVNITLQVDMSNETISPEGVFIAGSFQDPQWTNQAMTPIGGDVYSITVQMGVGSFQEYKFKNGPDGWETVPPQCAWNNNNRYLEVPAQNTTLPLVCFGSCDPCSSVTDVDITFQVDMSEQTVAPEGVHIAGGFQGWNPAGTLMTDLGNGIWSHTTTLQSGTYQQYKFVNGDEWVEAETNIPWYCISGGDRYLTVPVTNTVLPVVCFGSCLVCNPTPRDITFRVDMSLQQVSPLGVHLAGSFQGWAPGGTPMTHVGNNIYEVTLAVGEGEFHEYKFINGNDWPGAETVPGECSGLGGNREFFIPASNTVLDLVCFGECGGPCVIPTHTFDFTVNLEGPFNAAMMDTKLHDAGLIPTYQPYNVAPWNYMGSENILFGPSSGIVDWVLVEFRSTDGDASTATSDKTFHRAAALLMEDGSVTRINGTSPLQYTGPIFNNLYVVIWHRNHLPVMSATALAPADGSYVYDFTAGQSYLDGQKLVGGEYVMIGGDSDANGTVNSLDKTQWNSKAGKRGYLNSDNDLDGQSDNVDKNDIWDNNNGLSAPLPWKCGLSFIDNRDNQSYTTVQIGTQCLMAKNLNIGTMIPGSNEMTNNGIIEKHCYGNNSANCDTYGGLYQWNEMMQYSTTPGVKGICPTGWHLPTNDEWTILTSFLGDQSIAGGKMKEAGFAHWISPNTGATNESGFTALPGGARNSNGTFGSLGVYTGFWSSSEITTDYPRTRCLDNVSAAVGDLGYAKPTGWSVRCIQD